MENVYFPQSGSRTTAASDQDGYEIAHYSLWMSCATVTTMNEKHMSFEQDSTNANHLITTVKTKEIIQENTYRLVWKAFCTLFTAIKGHSDIHMSW